MESTRPDLKNNHDQQVLWRSFLDGDTKSFEALYHNYVQLLYRYGRKFTSDEVMIEDAIHEVFLSIWKGKSSLSVPVSVRYYLYASLKRAIFRQFSKLDVHSESVVQEEYQNARSQELTMEEEIVNQEIEVNKLAMLKNSYQKLSQPQQQAVFLKFYQGKSTLEIAEIMGMGKEAIYKLVQRALIKMKK